MFVALSIVSCQKEEVIQTTSNEFKTLSISEVLSFIELNIPNKSLKYKNSSNGFDLKLNKDDITYEKITKSSELLTVIPADIVGENTYTRVLMTKHKGEIKAVLFTMFQDSSTLNSSSFSGLIYISDIEGNFKTGFVVRNNQITKKLVRKNSPKINERMVSDGGCQEGCPYINCDLCPNLDTVDLGTINSGSNSITTVGIFIDLDTMFRNTDEQEDPSDNSSDWDSLGGGGGGSGATNDNRCSSDKIYNTNSKTCECPSGTEEDTTGKCITESDDDEKEEGPSCKSFDFKKVTSIADWQEASVVNIRFNIVLIEIIGGVRVKKVIPVIFPQPVKFGMPLKFKNNTPIPSGLAAEIGARSINHAIDDVLSKYTGLVLNSTDVIRSHFQERLKLHFKDYSNGGRVNFNDMTSTTTATEYQTYGWFKDNCY